MFFSVVFHPQDNVVDPNDPNEINQRNQTDQRNQRNQIDVLPFSPFSRSTFSRLLFETDLPREIHDSGSVTYFTGAKFIRRQSGGQTRKT